MRRSTVRPAMAGLFAALCVLGFGLAGYTSPRSGRRTAAIRDERETRPAPTSSRTTTAPNCSGR